ncbi:hypothetical protein ES703_123338 [subsurface metagenome]
MSSKERTADLVKYRLENSKEKLGSAKLLLENDKFKDSISRSYYAMYTAARALLATKHLDSSKHSGVISLFNQHFVKTGVVARDLGRILMKGKDLRQDGDYKDFVETSMKEAQDQYSDAEKFIDQIEDTLTELGYQTSPHSPNSQ